MAEPHDVNLTQWALGIVTLAVSGAITWLRQIIGRTEDRMNAEHARLRATITEEDGKLWAARASDLNSAQAFREHTLERLGEMPTKQDLAAMEARLLAGLDRRQPHQ